MWKEAARRGVWVHAGSTAAGRTRDDCGRMALADRRAAERGVARAMFLRPSILMEGNVWAKRWKVDGDMG